jgi:hypothetical protein
MQKTKAKRSSHWLIRWLPFAILWAISGVIMSAISNAFTETSLFNSFTYQQMGTFLVLWVDIAGGMIQLQLVERLLKRSMRGWLFFTLVGNLITLFLANQIYINIAVIPASTMKGLIPLVYLAPPLILQTIWLARRVQKPWLWGTSTVLMSLGFNRLYEVSPRLAYSPVATILSLLSGFIVASVMYTLWAHPKDTEKAKVDFAVDSQADERLARLQERDRSKPLWEEGDHPTLQSES